MLTLILRNPQSKQIIIKILRRQQNTGCPTNLRALLVWPYYLAFKMRGYFLGGLIISFNEHTDTLTFTKKKFKKCHTKSGMDVSIKSL